MTLTIAKTVLTQVPLVRRLAVIRRQRKPEPVNPPKLDPGALAAEASRRVEDAAAALRSARTRRAAFGGD
jgi:hypothetical protein